MTADYSKLAEGYEEHRVGYSAELYAILAEHGLKPGAKILDVACGTGLASEPLAKNGAQITGVDTSEAMLEFARARLPGQTWMRGNAEELEFPGDSFDAAICAQAFHWFDRVKAMREMVRVTKRGGTVAIWWKHLMSDDPVNLLRAQVAKEMGVNDVTGGLTGGFVEFYSAPLADHALRVVPWRMALPVDRFLGVERSSRNVHDAFGANVDRYIERLGSELREKFGTNDAFMSLGYLQFLYLGKKA